MLLTLAAIIGLVWLVGLLAHVAGGFINFLLVVAIVLLIAHFFSGRTHTV
jgi:hypothetical protein